MTRTTFYQENYQGWPPVANSEYFNPNSQHWHEQAMAYGKRLCDRIGYEDYCIFIDDLEDDSWYAIYRACESELARLDNTECTCVLPEQSCEICEATARRMYPLDEIAD